ncbi:MAG: type II toxin-antitoxin system ParD family antitoxin [Hyphomonadaceae bacterium]|nr:type II toxin-antitoxin system ParD family antitoxin [Hyphomonadaceae bacterium]GIK50499.1 MAG: hypothetical protein BroJett013_31960 [Alphaproteobacteria bacterium]
MSDVKVTLSGEAADRLLRLVAEQKYARPEEAIEDALDALEESRASDLDAWLRDVVAARADALAADPSRALSAEEVRTRLLKA